MDNFGVGVSSTPYFFKPMCDDTMVINIEATILEKGYNPNDLKPKSSKKVWAVCDECEKGRWVEYKHYRNLCGSCSHKGKKHSIESRKKMSDVKIGKYAGEKHHFYGKHLTKEHRQKLSEALIGKYTGDNSPNYGKRHSEETLKKMSDVKIGVRVGEKHHFYGKHLTEEHREKISKTLRDRVISKETRVKMSEGKIGKYTGEKCHMYGKHLSAETRRKISEANIGENHHFYGKHLTEEHRQKIGEANIGDKNAMYGKHHSDETREKLSKLKTGLIISKEARKKASATKQGISYEEWECFAREKLYCPAFNEACRESNREKYGRKCFICGLPESENVTKSGKLWRLSIHHVDMNKQQGCDDNRWKLVPLCIYHHHIIHTDLWMHRIIYLLNTCWD